MDMRAPRKCLRNAVSIALAYVLPFPGAAQSDVPRISVEVPTVEVDVIVTDRKGHHVAGLKEGQFRVFEDNVPQEIAAFQPPEGAGNRVPGAPGESERPVTVQSNSAGRKTNAQSITLLIDSGDLPFASLKNACQAAAEYVEKDLSENDQMAVYWVDSSLHLAVPFTSDKRVLTGALDKLGARDPSGRFTATDRIQTQRQIDDLFTTIYPETLLGVPPGSTALDPMKRLLVQEMNTLRSWLVTANTFQARAIFMALRAMALAYEGVPGRKTVVVFSEGFLHAADLGPQMKAVIDAANRANVAFYVIDASGGNSHMSSEVRAPDMGGRRANPDMMESGSSAPSLGRDVFDWNTTLASDTHEDLGLIANATGGLLVTGTNDVQAGIERAARDGAAFYTITYHPANRSYDGAFRRIKVALDAKGYQARFRQGYWAVPPDREAIMTPAAAQLLTALEAGSRKPKFEPHVNAALVQSKDGRFSTPAAVSLPGNMVPFEKAKDRYAASVMLLLTARDSQGRLIAVHEGYSELQLDKHQRDEFRRGTFNLQGHVPVPAREPVTLQAIVQFANGTVGMSAPASLDAPGNSSGPELTSLVLSNHVETANCGGEPADPLCIGNMRIYLPAQRRFRNSGKLDVYFAAVDMMPDPKTNAPVLNVTFELRAGDKTTHITPERIESIPSGAQNSLLVLAQFSLAGFQPGQYILLANADDMVRSSHGSGQVDFAVE